ncbi:hypothetical protein EDC96DRAFT_561068 [Choanephora cucurbitarum]|nr:hypothetical protein EDC96DRAFT_561068 [Choanephora cucurbitarum]
MSYSFYFEDGQGNIINENGNDPMDNTYDEDPYKSEELACYSAYMEAREKVIMELDQDTTIWNIKLLKAKKKKKMKKTSNEVKAQAVHLFDILPKNCARAIASNLDLKPRSLRWWHGTRKKVPDSLFKTIGRPRMIEAEGELAEATKNAVTDFYYIYPTVKAGQLLD